MALRGFHRIIKNHEKNLQTIPKWTKIIKASKKNPLFYWLYEGTQINDKNHGYGVLTKVYKDNEKKKYYAGYWINGKMHGFGAHWYDSADYYEGNFNENKRSEFGRIWHNDGSYYQGFWKGDLYNGTGMLIYANGNRYEGKFINGKKTGHGIFYHFTTGQMQEGVWILDVCVRSVMCDISNRQSAPYPTPYPIRILGSYVD